MLSYEDLLLMKEVVDKAVDEKREKQEISFQQRSNRVISTDYQEPAYNKCKRMGIKVCFDHALKPGENKVRVRRGEKYLG